MLQELRQRAVSAELVNQQREQEFKSSLETADRRVQEMRKSLQVEKKRQERLLKIFETNQKKVLELEGDLHARQGDLGELFGVVRQFAGDFHAQLLSSLTMVERPEDLAFIHHLSNSRKLPNIAELSRYWLLILEEMVGSGRVTWFNGEVLRPDGRRELDRILRVGSFNAIADGLYLSHIQGRNQFLQLSRQPQGRYLRLARNLEAASPGEMAFFALDPAQGAILAQLVQSPSPLERVRQGRAIGVIILALGLLGLVLFVVRFVVLTLEDRRIKGQLQQAQRPMLDNPLGRVLALYDENRTLDPEALEIRLNEAVMRETPRLKAGLTTIKILAAVTPLLGLLGTVVGMIETFQVITLFGTGDPKLMAGGISQALVTTALGLTVAIPLLFMHNIASTKSQRLLSIMEEQGAGLLADHIQWTRTRTMVERHG